MQIYVTLCQARAHSGLRLAQKKFPGDGFCFLADAAASDDVVVSVSIPVPSSSLSFVAVFVVC